MPANSAPRARALRSNPTIARVLFGQRPDQMAHAGQRIEHRQPGAQRRGQQRLRFAGVQWRAQRGPYKAHALRQDVSQAAAAFQ
ncbi:MAG: hypothetical protein ABWY08_03610 [Comamonas sp.]